MISEKQQDAAFLIDGPSGHLEVAVTQKDHSGVLAEKNLLAIICHPHPVHGGTMDNKVITTLARGYRDAGITNIRFNFRGVGRSEGAFDNAVGELEDLIAVADWCGQQYGSPEFLLAGFSFGSSIAAQAAYKIADVGHLLLVAPPVERYPYARDARFPCPVCVVQGGRDERVDADAVSAWVASLAGPVELIRYAEASHFFHGTLTPLKTDLMEMLKRQLG